MSDNQLGPTKVRTYCNLQRIDRFEGQWRFLSNFSPARVWIEGRWFPTVENAYQSMKSRDVRDRDRFVNISPGDAKRLGRKVSMRSDWESIKLDVMAYLLGSKFRDGSELAEKLEATYPAELIEGNTWGDRFWGMVPVRQVDGLRVVGYVWHGENHLGKLLMKRRAELCGSFNWKG